MQFFVVSRPAGQASFGEHWYAAGPYPNLRLAEDYLSTPVSGRRAVFGRRNAIIVKAEDEAGAIALGRQHFGE